jgi:GT2 family glycosyltransferase
LVVSVIIPVYNGLEVIGACIDSLAKACEDHDLEIIVIDDCSKDDSYHYLRSHYRHITLFRNDNNQGYALTVNRGIAACHGDYIFLLNQDTVVRPGTIDTLVFKCQSDNSTGIAAPCLLNPDGSRQKSVRRFPCHSDIIYHHLGLPFILPDSATFNRWKMADFAHDKERYVDQPAFSAVMIRRQTLTQVGLLDTDFPLFFNDVDYCRRVIDHGWKIYFCPEAEVEHKRGQATGQIAVRSVYLSHEAFIKYLGKYYKGVRYLAPNFICSVLLVLSSHIRALYRLIRKLLTSKE